MELRVLRYFLAVAQEGNLSSAAEVLHVTQPTLSRQLADLEREWGVTLFKRGNRHITLTEQGLLLRRRAEEVLHLTDKLEEEIREPDGQISGTVSIGAAEAAAGEILPQLLRSFSAKYPLVRYEILSANADSVREQLDKGLIDIGLLTGVADQDKYESIRLPKQDRWGILTALESPLAAENEITAGDLEGYPLAVPMRTEFQNTLTKWAGDHGGSLRFFSAYNLLGNIIPLVTMSLCHALTLEYTLELYNCTSLCFRPLAPELLNTSVLVWKKHPFPSETVRRFIQEITTLSDNSKV